MHYKNLKKMDEDKINEWMRKVKESKNGDVDLSRDEDLSIAIMNLISLEEHFYFTAMKTNNEKYLDFLNSIRELRKSLLKKIVVNPVGEEWCISKHLLASSMRLIEVGTKELSKGNKAEANFFFKSAFQLYSLFFGINLKMVEVKELKDEIKIGNDVKAGSKENGIMEKFSMVVKKIVDCCKE